ncbi:hypothetical protein N7G274_004788 [Stereocaulon virgatum]|uniref:Arrestin-like N-terminal domain-containing protein n=1 Tax=Stereocaulon virgatum TaxID=373712 RepID=A0ABR4A8T2_9LECA
MSIKIYTPHSMCRAGDTISGTVTLHCRKGIDTKLVTISLVGVSRTCHTRQIDYVSLFYFGRVHFLNETRDLFEGPQVVHPETSWPFTLTVPTHCISTYSSAFAPNPSFNSDPGQILPPSCGSGGYRSNRIDYALKATLQRSRRHGFSRHLRATKYLIFYATRDVDVPDPRCSMEQRELVHRSLRVKSEPEDSQVQSNDNRRSTRKRKMPKARFRLNVFLPTVAVPGQALPIKLSFDHNDATYTAMPFPTVSLKKCKVYLRLHQHTRCSYDVEDWARRTKKLAQCNFSREMHKAPPITEGLELNQLMEIEPPNWMPSWETFNFEFFHVLRIKLYVECAGQTFKVKCGWRPITLLPIHYIGDGSLWDADAQEEAVSAHDAHGAPVQSSNTAPTHNTGFGVDGALPHWEDVKQAGFVVVFPTTTTDPDRVLLSDLS